MFVVCFSMKLAKFSLFHRACSDMMKSRDEKNGRYEKASLVCPACPHKKI